MEDVIRRILNKAKLVADEREYWRSRTAHINGRVNETWIDYFYQSLLEQGMILSYRKEL